MGLKTLTSYLQHQVRTLGSIDSNGNLITAKDMSRKIKKKESLKER